MKTICIMCPVGCELEVTENKGEIVVKGNSCSRGLEYGKQEYVNPSRVVTALVRTKAGVVPVKTTGVIPKTKIPQALKEIGALQLNKVKFGQIVIKNLLDTGVNVVVTSDSVNK